ncbi:acyltransferase family protein [Chromobacterium sp. LK11]|uniref:acyltransferase family protein n=1 Tax=Chromobacterium sp. LK11 TaxID=1628212 RepID=UPI0009E62312|nr:acyltransferase family protein [Chromobacterium sp. LK11]
MTTYQAHLSHPKYRPDIDGLRAVAVLAVVAFHAFPGWVRGGFIGVDVFFVISGYLISTIIFDNLEKGTFSFSDFYSRRIRRIFPALLLVLIACFAFGWFALLADEYKQLGKHIAGGAGFVSNFVLWNEAGYFDNSAETKPLLHLWSLGIEEQFYIAWPFLLWFAWKRNFNLLTITIIVSVITFSLNIKGVKQDMVAAFYSPKTRFWELLSGSLLAWVALYKKNAFANVKSKIDVWLSRIVYSGKSENSGKTLSDVCSFLGLFLLLYGFWRINKELIFPGTWALVPVLGAVLIITAGSKAWVNRIVLSNKIAVWFGLISFPLYLWHWPLLSFARIVEGEAPSRDIRIAAIVLSVVLAWLTCKLIERPLRFGNHSKIKVTVLVTLMTIVGYVGYNIHKRNGLEFRVSRFAKISKAAGEWQYPGKLTPFNFEGRTFLRQNSKKMEVTLFIGDSNSEQYYVRTDELISTLPNAVNSVIFATGGGCLAIPASPYDEAHKHCTNLMESAFNYAKSDVNVKNIVIGAQWPQYLKDGAALTGKFGVGEKDYLASLKRLAAYIRELKRLGKNVYIVLSIPIGSELDPKFMIFRGLKHFPHLMLMREGGLSRQVINERYGKVQEDLRKVVESSGAKAVNPMDFLCNSVVCPSVDGNGEPIYKDGGHLRPAYVRDRARFIDSLLTSG